MVSAVDAQNFSVTLLDGVTGSGKTEVYFEAVARTLGAGAAGADHAARNRADQPVHGPLRTARFGAAPVEWHSALSPGRARPRLARCGDVAKPAASSARARRFSCPSASSASSSSTRSTTGLQAGRPRALPGAATWPWCAAISASSRSSWPPPRRRSRATSMRASGRYRHVVLPGRFSGVAMPDVSAIDMKRETPEQGKWLAPPLVAAITETLGKRPADTAVSQSPRLRAADAVPLVRPSPRMSAVYGLAGRASLQEAAEVPPLRLLALAAREVPEVRSDPARSLPADRVSSASPRKWRSASRRRAWRCCRPISSPALTEMREMIRGIEARRIRYHHRHADRRQGPQLSRTLPSSASSTAISASRMAPTRAPPSARSSSCIRSRAAPGARSFVGRGFVQTYSPDHPVMKAIVAGDREAFLNYEVKTRQAGLLPPYGRLAAIVVSARDKALTEATARDISRRAPAERDHFGSGPDRSADCRRPRPPSLAAARQGAARRRFAGLSQGLGWNDPEAQDRHSDHRRRRSLQLPIGGAFCRHVCHKRACFYAYTRHLISSAVQIR